MRSIRLTLATAVTGTLAAALTALLGPAMPAQAYDDCTTRTTSKAFAAFGDTNEYFPVTNGTFESGSLSPFAVTGGAYIAQENESWRVLGSSHNRSVALPPGATLRADFCVQVGEDSFRAFTKSPGAGASLKFDITVRTSLGSSTANSRSSSQSRAWEPTARVPLYNVYGPDSRQYVTVLVTNNGSGTWLLDDLLIDPWRTR
jgi:hypothetical protein